MKEGSFLFSLFSFLLIVFCVRQNPCIAGTESNHPFYRFAFACQQAADSDVFFNNFKQQPDYREVVEHVNKVQGDAYLQFIMNAYPFLEAHFEKFRQNDIFGGPICYSFGRFGLFSPTTLRYVKVAGDLVTRFGDMSKMHILEIGGGYGGQCKILNDLGGFASYTIVDLPEVNALIRKYLQKLDVKNVILIDTENLDQLNPKYDLLISNYSILEFNRPTPEKYCEIIFSVSKGYITGNFFPYPGFISRQELIDAANTFGVTLNFEVEEPLTGEGNCIITWRSHEKIR